MENINFSEHYIAHINPSENSKVTNMFNTQDSNVRAL